MYIKYFKLTPTKKSQKAAWGITSTLVDF